MAKAKLVIKESDAEVKRRINKALSNLANSLGGTIAQRISSKLRPVLRSAIASSPEIASLRGGILQAEFGLTSDPTGALVETIVSSLSVSFTQYDRNLRGGGIRVTMQPTNFANLLSQPFAEQPIEDGGSIPWLEWLLTLGDSIIIVDYGVEFGSFPESRTGKAVMRDYASPYKVNSAFSGTADDNFITRALSRSEGAIFNVLKREFYGR